jgi:hypothetical protein
LDWTKSSRGSRYVIQQSSNASREIPKSNLGEIGKYEILTEIQSQAVLAGNNGCCSNGNCLYEAYRTQNGLDTQTFCKQINDCRLVLFKKHKDERKLFLFEAFKDSIDSETKSKRNLRVIENHWKAPNDKKICRKSWRTLYNFSAYAIEKCSERLKENIDAKTHKPKPFTDETLHEYTQNEVLNIFNQNLSDTGIIMNFKIIIIYL